MSFYYTTANLYFTTVNFYFTTVSLCYTIVSLYYITVSFYYTTVSLYFTTLNFYFTNVSCTVEIQCTQSECGSRGWLSYQDQVEDEGGGHIGERWDGGLLRLL